MRCVHASRSIAMPQAYTDHPYTSPHLTHAYYTCRPLLMVAACNGNARMIETLLNNGADPNVRHAVSGHTVLSVLCASRKVRNGHACIHLYIVPACVSCGGA